MANLAPFTVDVTGSDDETFSFSLELELSDGTEFPFDDYTIEYVVEGNGLTGFELESDDGITVDGAEVTFKADQGSLTPGRYEHGCRIRHVTTDETILVFDGSITITEGHFT